jgi:NAD(P)-dependent dehydrogenase (short-subunit alcohol dehydrogenase family)
MKRTAFINNVLQYAGPASISALYAKEFQLLVQDPLFADPNIKNTFLSKYPNTSITSETNIENLINQISETFPTIDVVISNDSFPAIHTSISEGDLKGLENTLQEIVIRPYYFMHRLIPKLKKQQNKSNLIFITSSRTELPMKNGAIPDMARAANNAFVKSLSIELAPYGIPVNAIAPNFLYSETYFPRSLFIENPIGKKYIETVVPIGRLGQQEELEELIIYLAEMKGSFHTGSIIPFNGGWPVALDRPY